MSISSQTRPVQLLVIPFYLSTTPSQGRLGQGCGKAGKSLPARPQKLRPDWNSNELRQNNNTPNSLSPAHSSALPPSLGSHTVAPSIPFHPYIKRARRSYRTPGPQHLQWGEGRGGGCITGWTRMKQMSRGAQQQAGGDNVGECRGAVLDKPERDLSSLLCSVHKIVHGPVAKAR